MRVLISERGKLDTIEFKKSSLNILHLFRSYNKLILLYNNIFFSISCTNRDIHSSCYLKTVKNSTGDIFPELRIALLLLRYNYYKMEIKLEILVRN